MRKQLSRSYSFIYKTTHRQIPASGSSGINKSSTFLSGYCTPQEGYIEPFIPAASCGVFWKVLDKIAGHGKHYAQLHRCTNEKGNESRARGLGCQLRISGTVVLSRKTPEQRADDNAQRTEQGHAQDHPDKRANGSEPRGPQPPGPQRWPKHINHKSKNRESGKYPDRPARKPHPVRGVTIKQQPAQNQ